MTSPQVRPSASVIVCSYSGHRWTDLLAAVASTTPQLSDGDECVVVIDHNEDLFRRARARFAHQARVRVIPSDGPRGLSGARNSGIAHSAGEVVAFLDDDARAAPDWLDQCLSVVAEPQVFAVGAAALPLWPAGIRPAWFPPEFDWVVGCSYRGMPEHRQQVRNVIGAAMAFRREAFTLAGPFNAAVGRIGAVPLGCEETELCIRVHQAEPTAQIVYLPTAVVRHRVTEERTQIRYFLRRCFREGMSKAHVARLVGRGDGLASEKAYVRRVLPLAASRELARACRGQFAGLIATVLIVAGVMAAGLGYVYSLMEPPHPHGS
jgi:GT2 family glycosyltransferase